MVTVCAPSATFFDGVTGRDDGARSGGVSGADLTFVVWDGTGAAPAAAQHTDFLIAGYNDDVFDPAGLGQLAHLRVLQLLSAGYEQWLPHLPAGVTLANGRGIHGGSTAELAIAGILALARGIPFYVNEQQARRWTPSRRGEIAGRRAVVLGAGDIGMRVAAVLELLDVEVTLVARQARGRVRCIADLPTLLPRADIVVLALPHTAQTQRLVDDAFLTALPNQAIVANVARGAVVDTDSLVRQLRRGRISAFLDVTDIEPLPAEHPLWSAPNLLLTPHVGGGTDRWQQRAAELLNDQLECFTAGRPLRNVLER